MIDISVLEIKEIFSEFMMEPWAKGAVSFKAV